MVGRGVPRKRHSADGRVTGMPDDIIGSTRWSRWRPDSWCSNSEGVAGASPNGLLETWRGIVDEFRTEILASGCLTRERLEGLQQLLAPCPRQPPVSRARDTTANGSGATAVTALFGCFLAWRCQNRRAGPGGDRGDPRRRGRAAGATGGAGGTRSASGGHRVRSDGRTGRVAGDGSDVRFIRAEERCLALSQRTGHRNRTWSGAAASGVAVSDRD